MNKMTNDRYNDGDIPLISKDTIAAMKSDLNRRKRPNIGYIDYLIEELITEDHVLYESAVVLGRQKAQEVVEELEIAGGKRRDLVAGMFLKFYLAGVAGGRAIIKRQLASNRLEDELKL